MSESVRSIHHEIAEQIAQHEVILYMKGSANMPMCGFSSTVVQILRKLGIQFKDVDVLQDPDIREGIKQYSNWPTIPQLYVKGEFIGGCDITKELYEKGELIALLQKKGVSVSSMGVN